MKSPSIRQLIEHHPVGAYFAGAFAVSWLVWIPLAVTRRADAVASLVLLLGGFGPPLSALFVVLVTEGRTGLLRWLARMLHWRIGLGWYTAAVFGIPILLLAGFGLYLIAGGAHRTVWQPLPWWSYALNFAWMLFVGGGQEEPGWRGFAQPRLQSRFGALGAALIIGPLWAFWHLPLFFAPAWGQAPPFVWFFATLIAVSIIMAWLFVHTAGSVIPVVLLHASLNSITNPPPVPVGLADFGGMFMASLAAITWLVAIVLVLRFGPSLTGKARERTQLSVSA